MNIFKMFYIYGVLTTSIAVSMLTMLINKRLNIMTYKFQFVGCEDCYKTRFIDNICKRIDNDLYVNINQDIVDIITYNKYNYIIKDENQSIKKDINIEENRFAKPSTSTNSKYVTLKDLKNRKKELPEIKLIPSKNTIQKEIRIFLFISRLWK